MTGGMTFTAALRNFSQYVVAAIFASAPVLTALRWVGESVGVPVDETWIRRTLEAIVFSALSAAMIWLGNKFPIVNWLMSFGRSGSSPVYVPSGDVTVAASVTTEGTQVFTETGTGEAAPPTFEEDPQG